MTLARFFHLNFMKRLRQVGKQCCLNAECSPWDWILRKGWQHSLIRPLLLSLSRLEAFVSPTFGMCNFEVQELVNALEGRDPVKVNSVKGTHYLVFQFFFSMQLGGGEALSLAYEPHGQSLAAVHMQTCTN